MEKQTISEIKFDKNTKKLKNSIIPKKKFEDFIRSRDQGMFTTAIGVAAGHETKTVLQRKVLLRNVDNNIRDALRQSV
tara:strand:+ start:1231 stop:1464 length:234 start_codon:yes stop_codon:yes gene_type:complete